MKLRLSLFSALTMAGAIIGPPLAHARTTHPTTVQVTARVISDCTVGTDSPVSFAQPYDPFNVFQKYSSYDESSSPSHVQIRCSKASTAAIYVDHGLYSDKTIGAAYGVRAMKESTSPGNSPISYVTYHLCQDSACAKEWGTAADAAAGTAYGYAYLSQTNKQFNVPVYGRINGGQIVGTGTYTDTVMVSVQF